MGRIVGIDLGTSTSEISILVEGKPFVIPNSNGETIIPSIVGINDEGQIIVGKEAREQLLLKPEDTIMEVKRLMGSDVKVKMAGKEYTPQEVSAYILTYLTNFASEYLGEKIERAVITVPAFFTDEQRRATVEAGKLAGLKVERIINEPTAASLDYGIDHMEECKNVLVYDLGGGTLDVTVLEMFEGVMEVKASSGNNKLGGKDFDEILIKYFLQKFKGKHNIDVSNDIRAMMRLKESSEQCKIALSKHEIFELVLPFFANVNGRPVSLEETVTRESFETLIKPQIDSTSVQINSALLDAGLKPIDIDLVILVGGSTRIPYVRKLVGRVMGSVPGTLLDPDMAVVRGACIQAAILNQELDADRDILVTDVCPYTLGVAILDEVSGMIMKDVFDIIIPRNITIPVIREKIYKTCADYQTKVEIKVYQGEYRKASSNNSLGSFMIEGIPAKPAFEEKIKVIFSYDVNGILNVEATILSNEKKANITVVTAGSEMRKEVDLTNWKKAPNSKKYRVVITKAQRVLENDQAGENALEIEDIIRDIKTALIEGKDDELLAELIEDLEQILFDLDEEDNSDDDD
ncbi:MAG TPA: Hsp70 family protein [Ruminiclostridium sp.]